jgi:hypothetical protein
MHRLRSYRSFEASERAGMASRRTGSNSREVSQEVRPPQLSGGLFGPCSRSSSSKIRTMSDSKERSGGGAGSGTIVSENGFGPRLKRSKAFLICKEPPMCRGRRVRRLLVQKRKSKAASIGGLVLFREIREGVRPLRRRCGTRVARKR